MLLGFLSLSDVIASAWTGEDLSGSVKVDRPEITLRTAEDYFAGGPVEVTVMLENVSFTPLLLNTRFQVNHPNLKGDVYFDIKGPKGTKIQFQRLVTPRDTNDDQFQLVPRGRSIERTIDLADFYGLTEKGEYEVRVIYRNMEHRILEGNAAWMGVVVSDASRIRIQ